MKLCFIRLLIILWKPKGKENIGNILLSFWLYSQGLWILIRRQVRLSFTKHYSDRGNVDEKQSVCNHAQVQVEILFLPLRIGS